MRTLSHRRYRLTTMSSKREPNRMRDADAGGTDTDPALAAPA